jgi:hypothetical protein
MSHCQLASGSTSGVVDGARTVTPPVPPPLPRFSFSIGSGPFDVRAIIALRAAPTNAGLWKVALANPAARLRTSMMRSAGRVDTTCPPKARTACSARAGETPALYFTTYS